MDEKLLEKIENLVSSITPNTTQQEKDLILEFIDNTLKEDVNNVEILSWKCAFYMQERNNDKAKEICNQILEIDPQNQFAINFMKDIEFITNNTNNDMDYDPVPLPIFTAFCKIPIELWIGVKLIIIFGFLYYIFK